MKPRSRRLDLSIEHLWPLAVLFAIWFFLSTHPVRPNDFWWHLRAGEQIVTTGRIPNVDAFSFTMAGRPYDSYASFWIAESAYYLLYSLGGLALLIFAHGLAIAAAYGLVLWLCWKSSGKWRVAAAGTFYAAMLGFNDWNLRPQGIGLLLGALYLWAICEFRRRARPWLLAIFPLGMLIWANSHGSFVVGLLLLAIWLLDETWHVILTCLRGLHPSQTRVAGPKGPSAGVLTGSATQGAPQQDTCDASLAGSLLGDRDLRAARRLVGPGLALATASLACLANPRGLGIIAYVQSLAGNPIIRDLVPEWAPPSFGSSSGAIFLVGLLLAATLLAVSPRRPSLFQILSFLCFALLGLQGVRFGVWFGLVMAPIVAEHLAATAAQARTAWSLLTRPERVVGRGGSGSGESAQGEIAASEKRPGQGTHLVLHWLLAGMLLLGAVLSTPWLKHILPLPPIRAGLVSTETPLDATRFLLEERPPGSLFNDVAFGSYLIWAAPDYPVFVDPRIELYPPEVWRDYLEISAAGEGWEQRLEEYGVNTLILSPQAQSPLVQAVERSPDWRLVYRDSAAVVCVRVPRPR
jgi:hypothetical protein